MKNRTTGQKPPRGDYRRLFQAIAALQDPAECAAFFADLCTPAELEAMADRWRAVQLLKAGNTYREISQRTGMSVTTVGRVARCLSLGSGGYERIWQRLQRSNR